MPNNKRERERDSVTCQIPYNSRPPVKKTPNTKYLTLCSNKYSYILKAILLKGPMVID